MLGPLGSFVKHAHSDGAGSAIRDAWRYAIKATLDAGGRALPSPYGERLLFTKEFYRQSDSPPSLLARLRMWRLGFVPKSYYLYDFEAHGTDAFLSDVDWRVSRRINGPAREFLDDKAKFYDLLEDRGYGDRVPTRYGSLSDGVLTGSGTDFVRLLEAEGALVVKEGTGAAGNKVHVCGFDGDAHHIDGERLSTPALRDRLAAFDDYMVTEYCRQADYADAIYPGTANTIRLITMNPAGDDPFLARAVHRIGADAAGVVDNFSRGGLAAEVRPDGSLSSAIRYADRTVTWHDEHPDTGARIAGVPVPGWKRIREAILSAAADLPELTYIGWDIVVTGDGEFAIIEGNSNTGTKLPQAHGPLLRDERVRRFYRSHGVI